MNRKSFLKLLSLIPFATLPCFGESPNTAQRFLEQFSSGMNPVKTTIMAFTKESGRWIRIAEVNFMTYYVERGRTDIIRAAYKRLDRGCQLKGYENYHIARWNGKELSPCSRIIRTNEFISI